MSKKTKATNELLETLHGLIAKDMLDRLQNGACEAKDWAVIVKFLKDNNINALIDEGDDAAALLNKLVVAGQQEIEAQMRLN